MAVGQREDRSGFSYVVPVELAGPQAVFRTGHGGCRWNVYTTLAWVSPYPTIFPSDRLLDPPHGERWCGKSTINVQMT